MFDTILLYRFFLLFSSCSSPSPSFCFFSYSFVSSSLFFINLVKWKKNRKRFSFSLFMYLMSTYSAYLFPNIYIIRRWLTVVNGVYRIFVVTRHMIFFLQCCFVLFLVLESMLLHIIYIFIFICACRWN